MSGALGEPRPLVTFVLRIWPAGPTRQSEVLRVQATHVQTGEVTYFRTIASAAHAPASPGECGRTGCRRDRSKRNRSRRERADRVVLRQDVDADGNPTV